MAELLQTERVYVRDLQECIEVNRHSRTGERRPLLAERRSARSFPSVTQTCFLVQTYLWEMTSGSEDVPPGLVNKDDIVFGNIQDIYEFHNRYEDINYQS